MGIFNIINKNIFSVSFENKIMKTISTPIFIKDFNKESENIIQLNHLLNNNTDNEMKKKIENEIKLQKYVHDSLSKVYFELNNSPAPFYGLHNLRLELSDNKSNIDFLIVTNQFCCIINCKSHQGNIEIDSQGSFSRWIKKGEKSFKEGMYSPVEENRRAELILRGIVNKQGLENLPILSLVVFTNPKATLNFKNCSEDFMDKVIKVDLINTKIRGMVENAEPPVYEEIKANEISAILKGLDTSVSIDYSSKFKIKDNSENILKVKPELVSPTVKNVKCDEETLIKALKTYRTAKASSNSIPAYFIFTNEEMGKIVEVMPKNKQELISIKGFGEVKFEKYGEEIIAIIKREYIKNLENKDKKNKKGFYVPAVIPIVLYNATRKWNAPRYFKDIVNKSELFGENIVNFKYELFDINHEYTKEELIKNNNITSAIFLLDQKVDPLEFLYRLKAVALEFNKLTDTQKMILKHWIRNTVDETIAEDAVKILESNKEGVEKMVANNAFMIEEMKEKVKKQDRLEIVKNAIKLGMDDETISKLTGLSIEEVAKIRVKN